MKPTTNRTKLVGAAALTAALLGGGAAGAVLGMPSISGAQTDTGGTTDPTTERDGPGPRGAFGGLDAAADALGMTTAELHDALAGGASIASVASDRGVDLQTVIDAMVADGQAALDELRASLPDRVAELVQREGGSFERGGRGHGERGGHLLGLDAAAESLGMTTDELRDALSDGDTLAEVAGQEGVDVQTVIDAMVADANARIEEEVAEGDLTQEEATQRKADVTERITDVVQNGFPGRH